MTRGDGQAIRRLEKNLSRDSFRHRKAPLAGLGSISLEGCLRIEGRPPAGWQRRIILISRRAFILGSLSPLLLAALPAAAQESCGAESDVVALADYVLANRNKLPRLQSRRTGAISAYLKIRYQQIATPEQIDSVVGPLVTAKVDRARELLIAWRIGHLGLEAMLAAATPEAESDLLSDVSGLSMLRAAVMSGEVAFLFDKIAALPEAGRDNLELGLVKSMVDVDDASALEIATEALNRKLTVTAGGLIATHADQTAWLDFANGLADKTRAAALASRLAWMPGLRGLPALPREPVDAQGEIGRSLGHQTVIAAAHTPERDFLMTYLNQTGDFAGSGAAAAMINDLTRDGAVIDMETAWLVAYQTLKEASPTKANVDSALVAIDFGGTRFGNSHARDGIDTMLAVEAFKSAAAGNGAAPDMVEGASKELVVQLPSWKEAAEALAKGGDLAPFRSSGQKLGIVANLLFANGKYADLTKFLTTTVPNGDSIRLAEVYAEALDRRCAGMLAFPGEAVTMPGAPLFRFEQ